MNRMNHPLQKDCLEPAASAGQTKTGKVEALMNVLSQGSGQPIESELKKQAEAELLCSKNSAVKTKDHQ